MLLKDRIDDYLHTLSNRTVLKDRFSDYLDTLSNRAHIKDCFKDFSFAFSNSTVQLERIKGFYVIIKHRWGE